MFPLVSAQPEVATPQTIVAVTKDSSTQTDAHAPPAPTAPAEELDVIISAPTAAAEDLDVVIAEAPRESSDVRDIAPALSAPEGDVGG